MRIIAGKFKGRRLKSPRGWNTRPTTDRVREAIFNLLGTRMDIANAEVLDLFCGTGAFGFEALSRGAAHAVFVDLNRVAIQTAAANASALDAADQCRFLVRDGIRYLKNPTTPRFDLVFADPPYAFGSIAAIPRLVARLLKSDGVLVLEHDPDHDFGEGLHEIESRAYGRTIVTIFRAPTQSTSNQVEVS